MFVPFELERTNLAW